MEKKSRRKSFKSKKSFRVQFYPFDTCIDVEPGTTILDAARKAGLPLNATCGGKATCGDCIIKILSGTYQSKPSAAISDKLLQQDYALACITPINDNLTIQLPRFQELRIKSVFDSKFFDDNKDNISGIYEFDPLIKKVDLELPSPTLEDNYSDLKRLERELQKKLKVRDIDCEYSVLKTLAHVVREKNGQITVVLFKSGQTWTIIDVEQISPTKNIYGIACDIGTTTVAIHLVDLQKGKILSTASSYNQQLKCGEDIISRINYAQKSGRLQELQDLIIMTINHLIKRVAEPLQISSSDIYYVSVSGNTTMIHLFLNLEPRYIREEPYVPTLNQVPLLLSRNLGVKINNKGRIYCSPSVGSYVGSDITAGLLCSPLVRNNKKISLFIDIGTNGELVVGNRDWLITCACSAGPAFEGSGIKCGMPATEGAIEQLELNDKSQIKYKVIGDCKPKGLCGSGLIDLLAELFIHDYIDRQGKMNWERAGTRLIQDEIVRGFLVEKASNCYWDKELIITENDITNLIRTKGAIFSACSLLLKYVGLPFDKIDSFFIAGGFGQHLNIENAIRVGLLPDLERNKFHYIGNSSLLGAYLILISDKNRGLANEIAEKMTYIELNTEPNYMSEYTGALFLPHTDMELFPSVKRIYNP